jgi:hypothetical protein
MITDPHLHAAEVMFHALKNVPCACTHNVPYEGSKIERKIVVMCQPCKAVMLWEALNSAPTV